MSQLDTKLFRDLLRLKSQVMAVALVLACGIAMLVMSRSMIVSISRARDTFYLDQRLADVFSSLKRAPQGLAERLAELPGVAVVDTAVVRLASLDLPGESRPATGLINSIPDSGQPALNAPRLISGRWPSEDERGEILVSLPFADANDLHPGATLPAVLNGRLATLRVTGLALAPNYVFEAPPGAGLPDRRSFGVLWMRRGEMEDAFGLDGAFNTVSLSLAPGALPAQVVAALDAELEPYGGLGAYLREDHPSDKRVADELGVLTGLSIGFPMVFLSVAAFMMHSVLQRQIARQREQIAILKAFGFSPGAIARHYGSFAAVMVFLGSLLGALAGGFLGRTMVRVYHEFFAFPELEFHMAGKALLLAVLAGVGSAALGVVGAVRAVTRLAPAEAMRPESPANFGPSLLERLGLGDWVGTTGRMALRNLSRRPWRSGLTALALALAAGILVVPNMFRDGVNHVLEFQWDSVQRETARITFQEPAAPRALWDVRSLPGVMHAEPFRSAPVELANGHLSRRLTLTGLPASGELSRLVDGDGRPLKVPPDGVVLSAILGDALSLNTGDWITARALQGERRELLMQVAGFTEDFAGVAATADIDAVNRILGEGDRIDGAAVSVDSLELHDFLTALKETPQASGVVLKEAMRESFRASTAKLIGTIQGLYLLFATVVACGIVYNSTQINLSERTRELATLRVLGFHTDEVSRVLVSELAILTALAIPAGLLIGCGFSMALLGVVNNETVRLPLTLSSANFAFATFVVMTAAGVSAWLATRKLKALDLVSVLKARD